MFSSAFNGNNKSELTQAHISWEHQTRPDDERSKWMKRARLSIRLTVATARMALCHSFMTEVSLGSTNWISMGKLPSVSLPPLSVVRTQRKDSVEAVPRHLNDGMAKRVEGRRELCKQQFTNWSDYDGRATVRVTTLQHQWTIAL